MALLSPMCDLLCARHVCSSPSLFKQNQARLSPCTKLLLLKCNLVCSVVFAQLCLLIMHFSAAGSGKTAAFSLPILERLLYRPKRVAAIYALILTPTRELAVQVRSPAASFAECCPLLCTVCGHICLFCDTSVGVCCSYWSECCRFAAQRILYYLLLCMLLYPPGKTPIVMIAIHVGGVKHPRCRVSGCHVYFICYTHQETAVQV